MMISSSMILGFTLALTTFVIDIGMNARAMLRMDLMKNWMLWLISTLIRLLLSPRLGRYHHRTSSFLMNRV
jgi:hypothetical protein